MSEAKVEVAPLVDAPLLNTAPCQELLHRNSVGVSGESLAKSPIWGALGDFGGQNKGFTTERPPDLTPWAMGHGRMGPKAGGQVAFPTRAGPPGFNLAPSAEGIPCPAPEAERSTCPPIQCQQ